MASTQNPKTIHLSPEEIPCQKEGIAKATITPGMLIERVADRGVQPHSSAGDGAQLSFAMEYDLTGLTIDDDYAAGTEDTPGDQVLYFVGRYGDEVYALLDAGESVADAGWLASAGNGYLRAAQSGDAPVAQALEAVDNSAGTAAARVIVELAPCCTDGAAS